MGVLSFRGRCWGVAIALAILLAAPSLAAAAAPRVFFDDFTYAGAGPFLQHGWTIRTEQGWPGITGGTCSCA